MICTGTISPLLLEKPVPSSAEGTGEKAGMQKSRALQKQRSGVPRRVKLII